MAPNVSPPFLCKEQLTAAAAAAFVLSVGATTTLQTANSLAILVLSAIAFVALYVSG